MDHEGLAAIYQENREALIRASVRVLGDRSAAEDVVQEAWVRALRVYGGERGQNAGSGTTDGTLPSPAWLFRVTLNLCYDRLRAGQRARLAAEATEDSSRAACGPVGNGSVVVAPVGDPEEAAERLEVVEVVRAAITALPTALREVIVLREYCDLKYREIATAVGCPVGTVMSRLHLARQRLKVSLAPYLELERETEVARGRRCFAGPDGVVEVKRAGGRG